MPSSLKDEVKRHGSEQGYLAKIWREHDYSRREAYDSRDYGKYHGINSVYYICIQYRRFVVKCQLERATVIYMTVIL